MEPSEKLYIGDKLIGKLKWGTDSDFPWAKGWFIPLPNFKYFEKFVEIYKESNNEVRYRLNILALENAGYKSADLKIDDGTEICYLMDLDYYADGTAYWRFSMSPFDEDD